MRQSTFNAICWPIVVLFISVASTFLSTLVGAICGWCVGLFFGDSILLVFKSCGITGVSMWPLGAFLGFVISFFRSSVSFDMSKLKNLKNGTKKPQS